MVKVPRVQFTVGNLRVIFPWLLPFCCVRVRVKDSSPSPIPTLNLSREKHKFNDFFAHRVIMLLATVKLRLQLQYIQPDFLYINMHCIVTVLKPKTSFSLDSYMTSSLKSDSDSSLSSYSV